MFKQGTIVKLNKKISDIYSILIPYGIIISISQYSYHDVFDIRLFEMCSYEGELPFLNHYIITTTDEYLEEL